MDNRLFFIGLGSNLGDRNKNLELARQYIAGVGGLKQESSLIETEPWGVKTENLFLNQVITVEGVRFNNVEKFLRKILDFEKKIGRDRQLRAPDRIIDIDILYCGDMVSSRDPIIPHPRLHKRKFVLTSLVEIAPDFVHPVFGETQEALLAKLKNTGS